MTSVDQFILKQLELIEIEKNAEIEENRVLRESSSIKLLQAKGLCIPKLQIKNCKSGLFGKFLVKFGPFWSGNGLPYHKLSSGDIVGVANSTSESEHKILAVGVISDIRESSITIAFQKASYPELGNDDQYILIKVAIDVTYRRIKNALKKLGHAENISLVDVLFSNKAPSTFPSACSDIQFHNPNLNKIQQQAVKFALSQKDLAILHGPPGTGKTTTLVECILQCISQKLKVLACAPSNIAVDNLMEKLAPYKIKMVRLGHPARFLKEIQQYSLDAMIARSDNAVLIEDMYKELRQMTGKRTSVEGAKLRKEIKEREANNTKEILKGADVILSTLISSSEEGPLSNLPKNHFDICVIDECSQALEAACWIPLLLVKRCILAGDHHQLHPTIISEEAAKQGLSVTLMQRLLDLYSDSVKIMLTMQYRMNQVIMEWPSKQLYENKLVAHQSVQDHLLSDLSGIENNEETNAPLVLIDTTGCDLYELEVEDQESKANEGEADIVALYVEGLIKSGVDPAQIAIITPYSLQVDLIKSKFNGNHQSLEIKSVDGFQGREKETVILSLVRSNSKGQVGFLAEDRRINVAITRAKRHLAVICNCETLSHHEFLKSFIEYCSEKGQVRSAFQYGSEIGSQPSNLVKQTCTKKQTQVAKSTSCNKKSLKSKKSPTMPNQSIPPAKTSERNAVPAIKIDLESQKKKYRKVISEFSVSDDTSYSFPPTLSSCERRLVHEISEELGIFHNSTGVGAERHIEIRKSINSPSSSKVTLENAELDVCLMSENSFAKLSLNKEESDSESVTKIKFRVEESKKQSKKQQNVKKIESLKPKTKTLKFKDIPNADEQENFDALIEQVIKLDNTCFFIRCKKSVTVLAQTCQFCKKRFCFSHFMPEIHGCGDLVKAYARRVFVKECKQRINNIEPHKKTNPIAHSFLKKKLGKKITELSNERKTKGKDKE